MRRQTSMRERSKPPAYLIGSDRYEAIQAELKQLRRAELLRDVSEGEEEIRRGGLQAYEDVDTLISDLRAKPAPAAKPRSRRRE